MDGSLLVSKEQWKQLNDDNKRLSGVIEKLRQMLSRKEKERGPIVAVAEFHEDMSVVFYITEDVMVKPGDQLECYHKKVE